MEIIIPISGLIILICGLIILIIVIRFLKKLIAIGEGIKGKKLE